MAVADLVAYLCGLLVAVRAAPLFGHKGTDVFLYRQAGAGSLGYAVMAFFAFRLRVAGVNRLPVAEFAGMA